jgi:hypothetical protein
VARRIAPPPRSAADKSSSSSSSTTAPATPALTSSASKQSAAATVISQALSASKQLSSSSIPSQAAPASKPLSSSSIPSQAAPASRQFSGPAIPSQSTPVSRPPSAGVTSAPMMNIPRPYSMSSGQVPASVIQYMGVGVDVGIMANSLAPGSRLNLAPIPPQQHQQVTTGVRYVQHQPQMLGAQTSSGLPFPATNRLSATHSGSQPALSSAPTGGSRSFQNPAPVAFGYAQSLMRGPQSEVSEITRFT